MLDEMPIVEYESIIMRQAPIQLRRPYYERIDAVEREVYGACVVLMSLTIGTLIGVWVGFNV